MLYLPAAAAAAGPYDQVARCPACEDVILTSRGVEGEIAHGPCAYCGLFFTDQEWDQRHSDTEGDDIHEDCCEICHGDDSGHRTT